VIEGNDEMMKRMVVGFMFVGEQVVLIQKNRPEWQKGLFNGVSGHVEPNESALDAMVREFEEEAGVKTEPREWDDFAVIEGGEGNTAVHFFSASRDTCAIRTMTDESVGFYSYDPFPVPVVSDLKWLVPLARVSRWYLRLPIKVVSIRSEPKI